MLTKERGGSDFSCSLCSSLAMLQIQQMGVNGSRYKDSGALREKSQADADAEEEHQRYF